MRELGGALDALGIYEQAVATGNRAAVTALVETMLTAGVHPVAVLTDVIAAAQRAVGARWQRGEWTVAQEHAATAMAVDATKTVMRYVRRTYLITRTDHRRVRGAGMARTTRNDHRLRVA